MATHIGIGFSKQIDLEAAAREAAFEAKTNLNTDNVDIALVFSSIHYDPQLTVPIIRFVLNDAKMIGCSTAGIILSHSIETRGIAVLTIASDDMSFGIGSVEDLDPNTIQQAGNLLARNALNDFGRGGRHGFLLFVDGHLEKNSALLKGLEEVFGNIFPILGAGSCDNFHFADSFQIFQESVLTNAATGLIIGGNTSVGIGCRHGWRPLGKPRTITKAEGNVIRTINRDEAVKLYQEYFGDKIDDLHSANFTQMSILYPLGIYIEGSHEYLLRNVVTILADGSIVCQGDVPEGAEVHIMIGNKQSCRQSAIQAAEEAQKNLLGKDPKLVVILESMARLKLLGRTAHAEIENVRSVFGANVPIIGMYGNGEISPFQTVEKFKKPYLLNGSIVILAIT